MRACVRFENGVRVLVCVRAPFHHLPTCLGGWLARFLQQHPSFNHSGNASAFPFAEQQLNHSLALQQSSGGWTTDGMVRCARCGTRVFAQPVFCWDGPLRHHHLPLLLVHVYLLWHTCYVVAMFFVVGLALHRQLVKAYLNVDGLYEVIRPSLQIGKYRWCASYVSWTRGRLACRVCPVRLCLFRGSGRLCACSHSCSCRTHWDARCYSPIVSSSFHGIERTNTPRPEVESACSKLMGLVVPALNNETRLLSSSVRTARRAQ